MAIDSIGGFSSITTSEASKIQAERRNDAQNSVIDNQSHASMNTQSGSNTPIEGKDKENENSEHGVVSKENSENHLKSVLSVANQKIRLTNTRCEFEYHEKTNRVSIKVIDKSNDKVIREIPPEETLEMVEKIWELAGLFVDEKR